MSLIECSDQCWMVWFRNGMDPEGRWYPWEYTHALTRAESIQKYKDAGWATEPGQEWRNQRRKGLVKCVRTTLVANLPESSR